MNKIKTEISYIINGHRNEKTEYIAELIHKQYLVWLRFHLPDVESEWTLIACLGELERIFKEE